MPASHHEINSSKLPPFWCSSPDLWFLQIKSQFHGHRITSDISRYNLTVSTFDMDTINEIYDIIRSQPPYWELKPTIISRLIDSLDAQLHKLLTGVELENRCSLQLIRHMRSLEGA